MHYQQKYLKNNYLKNVLYVSKLYGNLLSVKKIKTISTWDLKKKCNTMRDGEIIAITCCTGNLYRLKTKHKVLTSTNKHNDKCIHTQYQKLGHRDPDAIKKLGTEDMAYGIAIKEYEIKEVYEVTVFKER